MKGKYDDIIHLPNHRSKTRPHMSIYDRAAQFSPFAALTGHEEAIKETARLTHQKPNLTEEIKAKLNARLSLVEKHLDERPKIEITYFVPDKRKSGGAYVTNKGIIKRIDLHKHTVIMENGEIIPADEIIAIEGTLFAQHEMVR